MSREEGNSEEARRDVSAARAELRGRRDQVVADYDDRLGLLDNLQASLERGDLTAKVVQDRVRQLLGERSGLRTARAGRTSIGMQVPKTAAAAPTAPVRSGPTPAQAVANLQRAMSTVDSRIVHLMLSGSHAEARLELALLRGLRRALEHQADTVPEDVVLLDSVVEYAEQVETTINDLEAGGPDRLHRLIEYDRELASQLVALGGSVAGIKDQLKAARAKLGSADPDLGAAMQHALTAFARLLQELERRVPAEKRSFFDDLIAGRLGS